MTFNGLELAALAKLGKLMAAADGRIHDNELKVMALEMARFGVSDSALNDILLASDALEFSDVIPVVKHMTPDEKKHAVSYLGAIMPADGEISESEKKICTLISMLCDLPPMTAGEAVTRFMGGI